jgi:nucleoside-diphosphate-sugar epimerase
VTATHTPAAVGQAYNIVDGQTTGREFIDRFCRWLGLDPLPARHEMVPWRGHFSGAKARRELAYASRVSYEEAMAETERHLVELGIIKR